MSPHSLPWSQDSPDFVRLASKCNALIIPLAAVGADDAFDVILDSDEVGLGRLALAPSIGCCLKGVMLVGRASVLSEQWHSGFQSGMCQATWDHVSLPSWTATTLPLTSALLILDV